jgi:RNA polymerase sigma-70 factor (ECF subfamily)
VPGDQKNDSPGFCPKCFKDCLVEVTMSHHQAAMSPDRTTSFLELLTTHERALSLYVHSLVPGDAAAEDILQQTKMILWKHYDDFEQGTNFLAWARKTAFHQILTHRRQKKRGHLSLDEVALEALGTAVSELAGDVSARHEALRACVAKLPLEHRQLIQLRYFEDLEIDQVADRLKRTAGAVYRALSRIRMGLMECVERQLALES